MARRISLEPHLTIDELEGRYRSTKDPVERSRWHFLWLLARGLTATVVAGITGYSPRIGSAVSPVATTSMAPTASKTGGTSHDRVLRS
jgi:hypothetical protein